jgi:hypothetical protein
MRPVTGSKPTAPMNYKMVSANSRRPMPANGRMPQPMQAKKPVVHHAAMPAWAAEAEEQQASLTVSR